MPLHASLRINSEVLKNVHISRMVSHRGGTNEYSVIVTEQTLRANGEVYEPEWGEYLNEGVMFNHCAEDGAVVCLQKALQAWLEVNPIS